MTYPTTALEPGATGSSVKQLQDWLVSQGYMTQAQVNTGYGTYGPQTTAAVLEWQKDHGVDYSSGPGYWGPRSITAASSGGSTTGGSTTGGTTTGGSTSTPTGGSTTTAGPAPSGTRIDGGPANSNGDIKFYYISNGDGTYQWFDTLNRSYGTIPASKLDPIALAKVPAPSTTTTPTGGTGTGGTGTGGGTSTPSGPAFPTSALEPGATGSSVKQLQDWLVAHGYMTQAEVDTGYGTYGPKTTAAVTKLQKDLGVDNSSGPGYFGPKTISAVTSFFTTGNGTGTGTQTNLNDSELQNLLSNPNLTADQKAAIKGVYDAVSSGDVASAEKLKAAMDAATKFSDPYFKAQIRLATDALDRGMNSKDGDLHYSESQLERALTALRESTDASKDYLSFNHAQELQGLARKYETDLGTTRDNLAAAGFTSSSKRNRAEEILSENNTGLVESSNKKFAYDTGNLDRTLSTNEASTQAQVENLRRLAAEGKLDLYRTAEGQVGSDNLPTYDGMSKLGDIGGDIPRNQVTDALSFARNFVF